MITDINLWIDSNERDIMVKGYQQTTYGYPRSYYRMSNYTDELLFNLSYQALRLWHKSMSVLSSNQDKTKCVTLDLSYRLYEKDFKKSSFYKAIKELVKYRLLLDTTDKSLYVVNIQHAYKLNSPQSYEPTHEVSPRLKARKVSELSEVNDPRPLAF